MLLVSPIGTKGRGYPQLFLNRCDSISQMTLALGQGLKVANQNQELRDTQATTQKRKQDSMTKDNCYCLFSI
jgi:hypothetical protein